MSTSERDDARTSVERAAAAEQREREARTRFSARLAAARRAAALRRASPAGRFVRENGLSLVAIALFVLSLVGQMLTGNATNNEERRQHGEPPQALGEYLRDGAFLEATAENWESEFLQMGIFVVLTAMLYQRGSAESKQIERPEAVDQDPLEARGDRDAPWPVRVGGFPLWLYRHSLSLALLTLFAISFALHAVGGAADYNEEQRLHGGASVTTLGYVATSRFWFESFQNWQSEFLAVAALVLLTIWLREEGSPQSKPVAAAMRETGK
jgi:hypothetical protein